MTFIAIMPRLGPCSRAVLRMPALKVAAIRPLRPWGKAIGGGRERVRVGRGTNILTQNDHQKITNQKTAHVFGILVLSGPLLSEKITFWCKKIRPTRLHWRYMHIIHQNSPKTSNSIFPLLRVALKGSYSITKGHATSLAPNGSPSWVPLVPPPSKMFQSSPRFNFPKFPQNSIF